MYNVVFDNQNELFVKVDMKNDLLKAIYKIVEGRRTNNTSLENQGIAERDSIVNFLNQPGKQTQLEQEYKSERGLL